MSKWKLKYSELKKEADAMRAFIEKKQQAEAEGALPFDDDTPPGIGCCETCMDMKDGRCASPDSPARLRKISAEFYCRNWRYAGDEVLK